MVSRFPDGVSVGTGVKGLSNLCDENLDNYSTLPGVADVNLLIGSPIVAVKDMKHYFDKDTKAGFKIATQSKLLSLSLLQGNYQIRFYKDGEPLLTSEIAQGNFTLLGLTLGTLDHGEETLDIIAAKQPNVDYDEIALVGKNSIDVTALKSLKILYAFVGENVTLTSTRIKDYDPDIKLTASSEKLINDNLTDKYVLAAGGIVGSSLPAKVFASKEGLADDIFPEGTEVGFVYNTTKGLSVGVTPVITLYHYDGSKGAKEFGSTDFLTVDLGNGSSMISFKAPHKFSGVAFRMDGVSVLGGVSAQYAFISPEPITAGHQCTMSPTATLDICSCEEKYVLNWDKKNYPDASWEMVSSTDNNVTFDKANYTLDFSQSKAYLEGNGAKATVVMKLTNTDRCSQEIIINYGGNSEQVEKKETALVNTDPAKPAYELGDGSSYGLNILSIVKNSANIISSKLNSFASYFGGVSLGKSYLCSVKKTEGMISDGSKALQAGFVVTAKGSFLSADLLKLVNVKVYNKGEEVASGIPTAAIAAKLIGSQDTHKLRYYVKVPAGTQFDEIRLYSTGLLGADLSVMNIYYAYTVDEDAILDDLTEGAEIISFANNGASINADRTQSIGLVNAGNGLKDLTNCIDGDLTTCTRFPTGVKAVSGSVLAVNLGVTATRNKQLVVVVNKEAVGLGLDVAGAIVVKTYKKKTAAADPAKAYKADEQGSEDSQKTDDSDLVDTFDDWSVLGANVITSGDLGFIFINPTNDYDEVAITEGAGVGVLDGLAVYGLLLRNDADGDGTPDTEMPSEDCKQDIVFDETIHISDKSEKRYKQNLTMYFKRTFQPNNWNSLVLPVNLTKAQFESAFGSTAKLSEAREVYQDDKSLVIGFKAVEETVVNGQTVYLQANKPYIIWVDEATVTAHQGASFATTDAGSIAGEIYVVDKTQVDGISYTYNEATALNPVSETFTIGEGINASWGLTGLQFQASYDPAQSLAIGDYGWNAGNLFHLNKAHTMKGYRCWLTPTWASASQSQTTLSFGFGQGELTGVETAPSAEQQGELKIFNLQGQRINGLDGVQPGIYIVNGKKMVVK